ncbi:MAG: tRNA (adenosine(37)-N6)-dimethylallyltransferase MiaA [Bacteroidales bacterium]|nr:tRNA (adenosine(37)-N6)-dimethylallyltransferase MiaA [Bacteroidales bacterium]MDY0215805.1 tRNA (adenosine(37)-N6)-dimethylallyltransferase MiaA [Bacteroidales bacterium]
MIVILGPTACGKTKLATTLASVLDGEIISADSRQVYRGMDIGTGKDLSDYQADGKNIPYHLIDIVDPGYEFSLFDFQEHFYQSYKDVVQRKKMPILCGGTGLYIESILKSYSLLKVPENEILRSELESKELMDLVELLKTYRKVHNTTDIVDKRRLIRAIEIEKYSLEHPEAKKEFPKIKSLVFGINPGREIVRKRITNRLNQRLQEGMVEEVQQLIKSGVSHDTLEFYGLEYKFISQFLQEKISFEEMKLRLNIAIHQFAKRQMTFFRRMEKNDIRIHWIDPQISLEEQIQFILSFAKNQL